MPRHLGIALADGRQQGHEVEDRVDLVSGDDRGYRRGVECVEHFERAVGPQRLAFTYVGGHDVARAVNTAQVGRQFRSDLTSGADNKYLFHRCGLIVVRFRSANLTKERICE